MGLSLLDDGCEGLVQRMRRFGPIDLTGSGPEIGLG